MSARLPILMPGHHLTPSELRVVELTVNSCMTGKQIARVLGIKEKTVEAHRCHVYSKLDIKCIQELCRWYWTRKPA